MSDPSSTEIKSDNEPWSVLENLILAQAIYKCGDTNWVAIARTIKLHPQIHRTSNFFTQKIKAEIRKDEERFRALIAELDEIRQGKWDTQLEEQLKRDQPEGFEDAQQGQGSSDTTKEPGKPDEADSTMADTAPSSLSSPASSALSDKQEHSSREANLVSEPQSEKSSGSEVEPTDVEMEDVQDSSATPKTKDATESADVEMEDATGESPRVASEGKTPKDKIDEDVKGEDETEVHPPQSKRQKQDSKSSPGEDVIKEEDATDIKADENEDEDEGEEGGTSEEEEEEEDEEDQSKGGRKPPKKIKTSTIPNKRKWRGRRGDVEEGYNSSDSETTDSANTNLSSSDHLLRTQMDDKKWKKILMMIWTDIANHRFGAVFMQPIKEQDAPGYYLMIKRPMDLKSIKERIRDG
ncbi:Bromodomain-containing protein 8, partial [Podila horticola]